LDYLLYSLHSFKSEIEERSPQYFDFHALRCIAAPSATLNVLPATEASETLMRACLEMDGRAVLIEGYDVPFSSICDRISATFGLSLLPVEDRAVLNAVDRTFAVRSGCINTYFNSLQPQIAEVSGNRRIAPQHSEFSEEAQLECFETIRKKLDQVAAARGQRVAELATKLATRVVERNGSELTYYVAGSAGPTIVVLNALGQGLEYWYRLLETLVQSYQVIIWEPRGTTCPPPPFGLADQVDDLEAVLKNEGIDSCHVVCWCTSPKVGIDFHLRRSSVFRSMILLNSTFKCEGGPEEFDTPYEKNLFSLCRMLVRKPTMAASVMKTFQSRTEPDELEILESADSEQMSVSVLSMMNAGLKPHVLGPFKTEETTLNYAHQMMDFWANDCRSKAAGITVPVLLIGAEYDQVISPLSSEFGAGLFPNAWYLCMAGATHYFVYDRAEMLAQTISTFIHNPEKVPGAHRKQSLIAQVS
jgi:pimeloyl-ACP methyl ester carboxylesterase